MQISENKKIRLLIYDNGDRSGAILSRTKIVEFSAFNARTVLHRIDTLYTVRENVFFTLREW